MEERTTRTETSLVADLNDLLQLDHDAVQAYGIAIKNLASDSYRETLVRFSGDHERHIEELTSLIRSHGGIPIELSHIPTGLFKLAVQKVGTMGGDRAILLAFKANERQVRDKYRRHAQMAYPQDVAGVIERAASDEDRHYGWVLETLDDLGAGTDTLVGRAEGAFELGHRAVADAVEGVERRGMERAEQARRSLKQVPNRVRSGAGGGLERAAGAVDRAGEWAEEHGGVASKASPAMHAVADGLERTAGYLRSQDFGAMRDDVERQVEVHPLRTTLIAVGIGFLVGRLLR